jgi:hypothetical protein
MESGGRSVIYDPETRVVVDDPEITKKLKREYRDPWEHPFGN